MKKYLVSTLVSFLCFSQSALAFDDLSERFTLDIMYHYSRLARTASGQTLNFFAPGGAMVQAEYTAPLTLFSRYFFGGDVAIYDLQTVDPTELVPSQMVPFQLYMGAAQQFGHLKTFELYFGAGVASEYYQALEGGDTYSLQSTHAVRLQAGFTYRILGVVGSVAQLLGRFSYPVTEVKHGTLSTTYLGILDGTFRLRFDYRSSWSLIGGIRFDQLKDVTDTEYFSVRIYTGLGLHF